MSYCGYLLKEYFGVDETQINELSFRTIVNTNAARSAMAASNDPEDMEIVRQSIVNRHKNTPEYQNSHEFNPHVKTNVENPDPKQGVYNVLRKGITKQHNRANQEIAKEKKEKIANRQVWTDGDANRAGRLRGVPQSTKDKVANYLKNNPGAVRHGDKVSISPDAWRDYNDKFRKIKYGTDPDRRFPMSAS